MSDHLSDNELEILEKLEQRAAPGPWSERWCYAAVRHVDKHCDADAFGLDPDDDNRGWGRYDGVFIANMRNLLPRMLAEIKEHRARAAGQEYA